MIEKQNQKINVKSWVPNRNPSQIYSSGLQYSFLSNDNEQVCVFVYCKDFLQDALMGLHRSKKIGIYGFSYDPEKSKPINLMKTKILITNEQDKEFLDKIPNLVKFLNKIEKSLKLIGTKFQIVENPPAKYEKCGIVLLESSNRWMLSPPMISMFTLLIRVGFVYDGVSDPMSTINDLISGKIAPYQRDDKTQVGQAMNGINKILKLGYAKIFYKDPIKNYPLVDTSTMHNNSGIVSFSNGYTSGICGHWTRKSLTEDVTVKPKKKKVTVTEIKI